MSGAGESTRPGASLPGCKQRASSARAARKGRVGSEDGRDLFHADRKGIAPRADYDVQWDARDKQHDRLVQLALAVKAVWQLFPTRPQPRALEHQEHGEQEVRALQTGSPCL